MPLFHPDADLVVEPKERHEHLAIWQGSQRDVSSDGPSVELDGALVLCVPAGEHTLAVDLGPAHAGARPRSLQSPVRAARMSSAVLATSTRAAGWSRRSSTSCLRSFT
jgi:hypothetical protein